MTDAEPLDERAKWNRRYADPAVTGQAPSALHAALGLLPRHGRAIELAGGLGYGALLLAERGLDVTLADISEVALTKAAQGATASALALTTLHLDLRSDPVPAGPWNVITCFHYLDRGLLRSLPSRLAPEGVLVVAIATVTNLERHDRPPRRFLLERGELAQLLGELEPISYTESWTEDDIHEARFVGRRST